MKVLHQPVDPVDVPINAAILSQFVQAQIATSWDIADFDRLGGWLAKLETYCFKSAFIIEGPSAFYGGPFGPNAWTADGGLCQMGAASYSHSALPEGMKVGRYCSIGRGLRFLDFSHPTEWISSSVAFFRPQGVASNSALGALCDRLAADSSYSRQYFDPKLGKSYPELKHDVWIGENVALAMGISIGSGAVIASGSIVTKDVPPYAIVAGAPAKVRKFRHSERLIEALLSSLWWRYNFSEFAGMDYSHPETFLDQLHNRLAKGRLDPWEPASLTLPWDLLPGHFAASQQPFPSSSHFDV